MDELRLQYFEGPDGAGKTTRIREILDHFDMYWHNGVYSSLQASYDAYSMQLLYLENMPDLTGCLDRGIFSDIIYGGICRNQHPKKDHIELLIDRMNAIGTQLVICLPPRKICMENWSSRAKVGKEYNNNLARQHQIYDEYCYLLDMTHLPIQHYDYTEKTLCPTVQETSGSNP